MKPDAKAPSAQEISHSRKKRSLWTHLAVGFLIFSVLLLTVLWLFQTVFLESFYKTVKTGQVKSCSHSLAYNIDSEDLSDLIIDIEEQNSMKVGVYSIDSGILTSLYDTDSQGFFSGRPMNTIYELYHKAVENGGEYASIADAGKERRFEMRAERSFDATKDETAYRIDIFEPSLEREKMQSLSYAQLVTSGDNNYLIVVESEITPVTSVVDTLRYQLIIMTAVIILLSVIIAVFVGKLISKPISDTNEKAKSLAHQDYDVTFSGGRYREITELNATLTYAASELKKVDSLQKELIANISHDLRTPLTMITGYSEVMRDIPGEMTPENIQIIIDEATRLNSLVTDLLDISRLQSGTADVKMQPFSLTDCIKSIFARYTKLVESDGLNIVFEHDGEVFVMGDELRMTQVLYNLVNNAVNYIGEDKTIIVRQTVSGDKVRVDVIDHGEGIPEEKLAYIWDRYYRVDKEHRRAKIGTGLGLSIVKNALLAHNAEFGVASKPGEGSDFYFILPVIPTGDE